MWGVLRTLVSAAAMLALWTGTAALLEARSDPRVRRADLTLPDWPGGIPPLRVVLLADLHVGTLSTPVARLEHVVAQVNALHPDLVLIAGDFLPGHDPIDATEVAARMAPLGGLHARLGTVAVPGNHDHWTSPEALKVALEKLGVRLLANEAEVRGPLVIAGIDDDYSRHAGIAPTVEAARRLPGARLALTHSPDIAPDLPGDFGLLLAGHTHCGQLVLPVIGPLTSVSRYGRRFECGIVREDGHVAVVTAGIGTSVLPVRLGARPDLWLITLRGVSRPRS